MDKHNNEICKTNRRAVQDCLDVIGGKWKIIILLMLKDKPYRFKELAKEIGITSRMLSRELQELEINKLIVRKVLDTSPIGVQYSITKHGMSFQEVIEALRDWGLKHRKEIISK